MRIRYNVKVLDAMLLKVIRVPDVVYWLSRFTGAEALRQAEPADTEAVHHGSNSLSSPPYLSSLIKTSDMAREIQPMLEPHKEGPRLYRHHLQMIDQCIS